MTVMTTEGDLFWVGQHEVFPMKAPLIFETILGNKGEMDVRTTV